MSDSNNEYVYNSTVSKTNENLAFFVSECAGALFTVAGTIKNLRQKVNDINTTLKKEIEQVEIK